MPRTDGRFLRCKKTTFLKASIKLTVCGIKRRLMSSEKRPKKIEACFNFMCRFCETSFFVS